MKKLTLIITFFYFAHFVFTQETHPIKETYDQVLEPYYSNTADYNSPLVTWWYGWGSILQSYLNMYKATGDKAYLNKFIKHSYGIQLRRETNEDWRAIMDPKNLMLYTGTLLSPMAEFVYIIKNDTQLYSTYLLTGIIPSTLTNPNQGILGYGDYANWLQSRLTQTLDYMIENYWIEEEDVFSSTKLSDFNSGQNFFCDLGIEKCVNCPKWAVINFQAGYTTALLYLGYIEPISYSDYNFKAISLVSHFKSLLEVYIPNQSYTWLHSDTQYDCLYPFKEDVIHGAMDMHIARVGYELYGNGLFSSSEMNKFTRTFTKNIWDASNQLFHNNVFGTDTECSDDQEICNEQIVINGNVNYYGPGEVLTWMPLYKYDDTNIEPNDVYTVLITQAIKLLTDDPTAILPANYCYNVTRYLSGTQSLNGLTEVVRAQWDKECVNLTLYNREMVYDQDFVVKNKITIAPNQVDDLHDLNDNSFADPVIQTNTFDVNAGVTVNLVAGESIELLPGFTANAGSTFSALISSSSCTDGMRPESPNNGRPVGILSLSTNSSLSEKTIDSFDILPKQNTVCDIFPNPTTGHFTLTAGGESIIESYSVYTTSGNVVIAETDLYLQRKEARLNLEKGTFIVVITIDGEKLHKKLVVL